MINFKLCEPPGMTGNVNKDIEALYSWCTEIYEAFWANEFYERQKRRKGENKDETQSD